MLNSFGAVIQDFIGYLKKPYRIQNELTFSPKNFMNVTSLFFVVFLMTMLLFAPIASLAGLDDMDHAMNDLLTKQPKFMIFLLAVVMAPLIEELIFRFPLKFRRPPVILCIGFLIMSTYLIISTFQSSEVVGASLLGLYILLSFIVFLVYANPEKLQHLEGQVDRYYPFIFYIIAILFGIVHFFNFQGDSAKLYLIPILVFPQMSLGILLGYLRLRFGMWSNIYVHALNNAIPMAILFMSPDLVAGMQ